MNHRLIQYLIIIIILAGIAGGYFYYQSRGSEKINSSQSSKLTSGLVGYWTMDGNDTSWSGNTATLTNRGSIGSGANGNSSGMSQSTTPTIGKIGQSLNFDGSDDVIEIPYSSSFSLTSSFTISGWFKKTNTVGKILVAKSAGYQGRNFGYWAGSTVYFDKGGAAVITGSTTIQAGQWYHTAITYDGSQLSIYLNGQSDATPVATSALTNSSYGLQIGARHPADDWGLSSLFGGSIDEVRIYNDRALSASEITELYNQGQEKINASQSTKLTSGLILNQTFDGNHMDWSQTTAEARDQSGNNNHCDAINNTLAIGKVGQALSFNGTSSYANCGAISNYSFERTSPFSITGWMTVTSTGAGHLLSKYDETTGLGIKLYYVTGSGVWNYGWVLQLRGGPDSQIIKVANGATVFAGITYPTQPVFFTATYDGSSIVGGIKFYKNGVLVTDVTNQENNLVSTILNSSSLKIGVSGKTTLSSYHNGKIDETRVYNRVLSQSEITELYNQGQEKINASQVSKLTNGLVGYWTFDGGDMNATQALDRSPVGTNTGTLTGTTRGIGKIGQALQLNGTSSDYVSVANSTSLQVTTGITVSAWVKRLVDSGARERIIVKSNASLASSGYACNDNAYSYSMQIESNDKFITPIANNATSVIYNPDTTVIPINQWTHLLVTYSQSDGYVRKYINGVADGTPAALSGTICVNNSPLNIGRGGTDGGAWAYNANTLIDEARIYNRALSTSEITELYNMGR